MKRLKKQQLNSILGAKKICAQLDKGSSGYGVCYDTETGCTHHAYHDKKGWQIGQTCH